MMRLKRFTWAITAPFILSVLLVWQAMAAAPALVTDLQISEYMVSNDLMLEDPDEPGEYPDWVEIHNLGSVALDLNGMYLSDDSADLTKHPITMTLIIPAGGYLLIYADSDPEQGAAHAGFKLSAGEPILLVDSDGTTIVDQSLQDTAYTNVSWGRCANAPQTWGYFATPSPAAANSDCAAQIADVAHLPLLPNSAENVTISALITPTSGAITATASYSVAGVMTTIPMLNTVGNQYEATVPAQPNGTVVDYWVSADNGTTMTTFPPLPASYLVGYTAPTLRINELMASNGVTLEDPDEIGTYPDWIELHNYGSQPLDLQGLSLQDSGATYLITSSVVIPAGDYVVFYADDAPEQGVLHTNFKLSSGGELVSLLEADGTTVIDSYAFEAISADISIARCPDDATIWQQTDAPTPALVNTICNSSSPSSITLNDATIVPENNTAPVLVTLTSLLLTAAVFSRHSLKNNAADLSDQSDS